MPKSEIQTNSCVLLNNPKTYDNICSPPFTSVLNSFSWLEDRHISVTWVASRPEDAKEADWLGKGHHGYNHLPSLSLAAGSTTWLELETSVPEVTPKAVFHTQHITVSQRRRITMRWRWQCHGFRFVFAFMVDAVHLHGCKF